MAKDYDSSTLSELTFQRCEKGFILQGLHRGAYPTPVYAFDKIEDLAAWLVREYGEAKCRCEIVRT